MPSLAFDETGNPVDADAIGIAEWESMRVSSAFGDYRMPCCKAPAIL